MTLPEFLLFARAAWAHDRGGAWATALAFAALPLTALLLECFA